MMAVIRNADDGHECFLNNQNQGAKAPSVVGADAIHLIHDNHRFILESCVVLSIPYYGRGGAGIFEQGFDCLFGTIITGIEFEDVEAKLLSDNLCRG
jgi:hypothetical protein